MDKKINKSEHIAICRGCGGEGTIDGSETYPRVICPQCEGSGRVLVSADLVYHIRAYKPKKQL